MKIIEKLQGDIAVLILRGKLIGPPETDELHAQVKSLLARNINQIVMDMRYINWMGSMGIGAIMGCMIAIRNAGGDLRISGLTDKLESLFSITQIIGIIKTFRTSGQAIDSFK